MGGQTGGKLRSDLQAAVGLGSLALQRTVNHMRQQCAASFLDLRLRRRAIGCAGRAAGPPATRSRGAADPPTAGRRSATRPDHDQLLPVPRAGRRSVVLALVEGELLPIHAGRVPTRSSSQAVSGRPRPASSGRQSRPRWPASPAHQAFPTLRCRAIVVGLEGVDQVSVTGTQAGETLSEGWNGERLPGPG